jgi:hypothetical protein
MLVMPLATLLPLPKLMLLRLLLLKALLPRPMLKLLLLPLLKPLLRLLLHKLVLVPKSILAPVLVASLLMGLVKQRQSLRPQQPLRLQMVNLPQLVERLSPRPPEVNLPQLEERLSLK